MIPRTSRISAADISPNCRRISDALIFRISLARFITADSVVWQLHADNTIMSVVVDDRNGDKLIFDFGHPIKDIVDFALSKMGSVNIGGCPYKGDDWIAMELSEGRSCDYHSLEILVKCKIPDDRMVEEKKPVGEMQEPETEKYLFDGKPLSEYAKTN